MGWFSKKSNEEQEEQGIAGYAIIESGEEARKFQEWLQREHDKMHREEQEQEQQKGKKGK